ncbi:MAG: hypothetical protein HGGPFJEG_01055 [Ignavibacteria bacterium]|nr:hypothetical protein [Ignavibacteria bacterium]
MKNNLSKIALLMFALILTGFIFIIGCGGGDDPEKGIGPIKEIKLEAAIDNNLVAKGKQIFDLKCVACHKFDEKLVGPPLKDVTKRRKPEWIMNMILNPDQMLKENMIAKNLLAQYLTPMTFQNVTQDDARALLEYFRSMDK